MKRHILAFAALVIVLTGCAGLRSEANNHIENEVRARIAQEPKIGLAQLTVREEAGVVSIGGFLGSLEQMRLLNEVIQDVDRIDGVTRVENNVTTISTRG